MLTNELWPLDGITIGSTTSNQCCQYQSTTLADLVLELMLHVYISYEPLQGHSEWKALALVATPRLLTCMCIHKKTAGDEASEWISSHLNTGAPSEAKIMKLEWQTIQVICRLIKILQQVERKNNTYTHTHCMDQHFLSGLWDQSCQIGLHTKIHVHGVSG